MLGVPERIIEEELDVRYVAQLQMPSYFPFDHPPGASQAFKHHLLSLTITDHAVVNTGVPEIVRQFHFGEGNSLDTRIFHDAKNRPGNLTAEQTAHSG